MPKSKDQFRILFLYPNLPGMLVPAMAVGLFTRILEAEGYTELALFDTTHYEMDESSSPKNRVKYLQAREYDESEWGTSVKNDLFGDFRDKVESFRPDLILVSVAEDVYLQACHLLESIEDLEIPHIMGGAFPTAASEKCFEHPVVRMIGRGEGEATVLAVAEAVRLGRPLHDIPGTWYRDAAGTIHRNPQPPLVDIDRVRPDFRLFEDYRFYRPMGGRVFKSIPIESYRGCPYNCNFCNSPTFRRFSKSEGQGHFLRRKSLPALRAEMEELIERYNPELFYIIDDSFLARPRQEIYDFCDMYQDIGLPFYCQSRLENCTPEVLTRLKEVGCYRISFGIECGNEEYRRKVLGRNITNEAIVNQFRVVTESGLPFSVNLIIGMPGETRELIMDTVELVRQIEGYDSLTVSVFVPYHGTILRDVAERNGWLDPHAISRHTTERSVLTMPPPFVNADDIDGLMRVLPLYCYFPKSEWDNIRRAETADAEGDRLLAEYGDVYRREFLKESQDLKRSQKVTGALGCRAGPLDQFVSPPRLTEDQLAILMP